MKSKVDKLDTDKLTPSPVDLKKLSDVVHNDVVKKTIYNELVSKVNAIPTTDNSDLVKKLAITQKLVKLKKKVLDHDHGKYITTEELNKLMVDNFAAKLAQAK